MFVLLKQIGGCWRRPERAKKFEFSIISVNVCAINKYLEWTIKERNAWLGTVNNTKNISGEEKQDL